MIKIIDQGMFPDKLPPVGVENVLWWVGTTWGNCGPDELENKDYWIAISDPEKPLEDYTEAELIEMWEKRYGQTPACVSFNPSIITLKEALIRNLK